MNPFVNRKILSHIQTLAKYRNGEYYPPIQVEIDLTNLCTSSCPWCAGYLHRESSKAILFADGETQKERWKASTLGVNSLIDDLADMGVKSLTWTGGGDPTCHNHWLDFIKRSNAYGMDNGLITNGVIDVSEAVPYCTWIRFSVDAASEENYGRQHGRPQHFLKVLSNIDRAAILNKSRNSPCTIGVAMVTGDETRHEILDFAKMWRSVPVDYIQYRPLQDTHGQLWFSDKPQTLDLIRQAAEVDNRVTCSEPKYQSMIDGTNGRTEYCHGIFFETAIAADGHVYTCCHHKGNDKYSIGDLSKERFSDIWQRHLDNREFKVVDDCPSYCRHLSTNAFIELELLSPVEHENFI